MRNWLTLALVLGALPGCYDIHGAPGGALTDAGALPLDAAMCTGEPGTAPGIVSDLRCPAWVAEGERVTVTAVHAPGACCPSTAFRPTLGIGTLSGGVEFVPQWDLCDCCLECRCVTDPVEEELLVAERASGTSYSVRVGTAECVIEVRTVGMCHPLPIDGYLVPDAIALGEPAPIHVRSTNGFIGCGCTPAASTSAATAEVTLSACDCCELCECVDSGYEATTLVELPHVLGAQFISLGELEGAGVEVVDPAACTSGGLTIGAPVVVTPRELVHAQPTAVWAEVPVEQLRCCGEPLVLADVAAPVDGDIDVTLTECTPDPCDCVIGTVHTARPNVFLGYLPAGEYRVRIGGTETPITVP